MPFPPPDRPPEEPSAPPLEKISRLEVMPHLSAPIDEGPLMPHPPRPWWDKAMLALVVASCALALLAYLFLHAIALR